MMKSRMVSLTCAAFLAAPTLIAQVFVTTGYAPSNVISIGEVGYFFARHDVLGRELFATDGTPEGTHVVADIFPGFGGAVSSLTPSFTRLRNGIVFFADGLLEPGPYFSDGTPEGTYPLAPGHPDIETSEIAVLGDEAFFFHTDDNVGTQLWKTDGTPEGTGVFFDFTPGAASVEPGTLTTIGDILYMTPLVGLYGRELWTSDGTVAGTKLVADIRPGPQSSNPTEMTALGDHIVFAAKGPVEGREVWATDGTAAGTSLVFNIRPGSGNSSPEAFVTVGDTMLFNAKPTPTDYHTYSTDTSLSTLSTIAVTPNYGPRPAPFGDGFIFLRASLPTPEGVWLTDGTPEGTKLTVPESVAKSFKILAQPGSDPRVIFYGSDCTPGPFGGIPHQFFVTDGTIEGTFQLEIPFNVMNLRFVSRLGDQLVLSGFESLFFFPLISTGAYLAETFGTGCAGSPGVPEISTSGTPTVGEEVIIKLDNAQPNALTYLAASSTVTAADWGCALLPSPPTLIPMSTDSEGSAQIPFTADASLTGLRLIVQWATFDPAGEFVNKASLTPGLELVFGH